jgi:hypothetical protein
MPGAYPFQSGAAMPSPTAGGGLPTGVAPMPHSADTIVVMKPLDVPLKFGRVRINPGTTLKVISRDGNVVTVNYMNSNVAIPLSATDWR